MSLYIETEKITGILLSDGWHEIVPGSCGHDAYEYIQEDRFIAQPKAETTGLGWRETIVGDDNNSRRVYAALNMIHAVREGPTPTPGRDL